MARIIKWGILSTAQIAKDAIIPAIKSLDNCKVTAIASRSLHKAKDVALVFDIPKYYGSYEELLIDSEIDAIYIPLPISMHAKWSIKCAQANKSVLCEKPLTLNAKEAQKVIKTFSEKKLLLTEALMYRYHPLTKKFIDMVNEGAIGKLLKVQSNFSVSINNINDIRLNKDTGGGAILDLGSYCVSIIRNITKEEPISATSNAIYNNNGVDTSFTSNIKFPSGVLAYISCDLKSQFSCGYSATGTKGKLLIDWGGMVPWPGEVFKIKYWKGDDYYEIEVPEANHYKLMIKDFSNSLSTGKSLQYNLQDSFLNMKAIDLLKENLIINK